MLENLFDCVCEMLDEFSLEHPSTKVFADEFGKAMQPVQVETQVSRWLHGPWLTRVGQQAVVDIRCETPHAGYEQRCADEETRE